MYKKNSVIDWTTFIGACILLLAVTIPLAIYPEQGKVILNTANEFITGKFGVVYLAFGLGILVFLLYIAFSRLGSIKLGRKGDNPEFSNFSWASMLFCAGIGVGIVYWGPIEWAYYVQGPPFGIEAGTKESFEWAATYGIYHWGPVAWAIYTLPAVPIAYVYHVRKTPIFKISEACRPVLGKHTDGPVGKIFDILIIFGLLGGAGTTLALGTPLIAQGINELTGIPTGLGLQTGILLFCTIIFSISSYSGIKKGIKFLSDINAWMLLALLLFVFIFGPTVFLTETTFSSLGLIMDNFFRMSTWAEPFNNFGPFERTGFPESWTVFYWAWWIVYAPFVGMFIAKISRGRTIRQMILGSIGYGSLGCMLLYAIFGNYGLYLQISGQLDVIQLLNQYGASVAIMEILHQLPLSGLVIFIFVVLSILFLATQYDSSSYILSAIVQKEVVDEPVRWNRLVWAFALSILPLILMYVGGLSALQAVSIIGGVPLLFIMVIMGISFIRATKEDLGEQSLPKRNSIHKLANDKIMHNTLEEPLHKKAQP